MKSFKSIPDYLEYWCHHDLEQNSSPIVCSTLNKSIPDYLEYRCHHDLEQNSSPIFYNTLNTGLLSFVQLTSGRSAWQQNTLKLLKTRFYSYCLTHHGGTNPQGSQELIPKFSFTCRQLDMVQISKRLYERNLKTVCCPLLSDLPTKIQPVNFTGTRHLVTTLVIIL